MTYGGLVEELDGDADCGGHGRGVAGAQVWLRRGQLSLGRICEGVGGDMSGVVKRVLLVGDLSMYERALRLRSVAQALAVSHESLSLRHSERDSSIRRAGNWGSHLCWLQVAVWRTTTE